jgi:hypothetical protein
VTEQNAAPGDAARDDRGQAGARKRYEAPRLIDYGRISKLTQSGGITTKDNGNMEQMVP